MALWTISDQVIGERDGLLPLDKLFLHAASKCVSFFGVFNQTLGAEGAGIILECSMEEVSFLLWSY